jgi:hypothetical protein
MVKTSREPAKAIQTRIIYPVSVVSDEPDGLEESDTDELIDEYQACAV